MTTTQDTQNTINGVTFSQEGRRCYVLGNTYPLKGAIKSAGGHWDGDRKAWWVGSNKREGLEKIVRGAKPVEKQYATGLDQKMKGKAIYKGKTYPYSFLGETKNGPAAKLHFRDGTKDFWAHASEITVVKEYREPISLRRLNEMAEDYKKSGSGRGNSGFRDNGCWECRRLGDYCPRCAFDEYDC